VQPGWHLYSTTQPPGGPIPTTITLTESKTFSQTGALQQPPAETWFDENFGIQTEYYEGDVEFRLPLRVDPQTAPGVQPLVVKVRFMLCSDTLCLPPQTQTLTTEVRVQAMAGKAAGGAVRPVTDKRAEGLGGAAGLKATDAARKPEEGPPVQQRRPARETKQPDSKPAVPSSAYGADVPRGTWAYVWFSMAMGGLALLTPCVFPMIPITVSYFTKRQAVSRKQAVGEAFLYSLGIVLTFTALGFAFTFLFGAGGINRLAANPWVNTGIALVFVVFALSLFGAFEIRVPSGILTALGRESSAIGGAVGILLMALTFSLTSFTCTVPFVGAVMVAALQGDWFWSLLGVTAFAAVFSAPFFLLAVFPSFLQSLPKSGNWMNAVKITMGFLELAAALKFVSNVDLVFQWQIVTRPVFIAVWLAIGLTTAVYLLGWFRFPHETSGGTLGPFRVLSAVFFFALAFYLVRGLLGFSLGELDAFLPPRDYGNGDAAVAGVGRPGLAAQERWLAGYEDALAEAKARNRRIFVDFTGYTCTNCRWMEANMFPLEKVQELLQQYVLVRLYTDGPGPAHARNLEFERQRFGTIALPYYAVMSADDEVIATFPGLTRDASAFERFLRSGLR
jgi:thiol:disulfide interchange protein DsbD